MARAWLVGSVLLGCVGCVGASKPDLEGGQDGPDPSDSSAGDGATDADEDEDDDPSMSGDPEASGDEVDEDEDDASDDDTEPTSTGCSFIDCGEDTEDTCAGGACECDVWAQDCPAGEKCAPWANDGGGSWNATKCVPIEDTPGQPGDECVAEGNGLSGFDDCDKGSMCWDVDETGAGTCIGFCSGNEAAPVCADIETQCVIANDGVLILCLPICDPLMSDCNEGSACYPADDGFVCVFDASGELGGYGDPCEFTNVCDPSLWCAPAQVVPGCTQTRCCTPFCDLSEPDPGASCPGAAGGQDCIPWYEEGMVPPGFEDLGTCAIPA
jgi:hypothetical protein